MIKIFEKERNYRELSGRPNLAIRSHIWEARESEPERGHVPTEVEIGMMHFLMEERAMVQGIYVSSKSWERQENKSNSLLRTLILHF